jgi:hypothetical protein
MKRYSTSELNAVNSRAPGAVQEAVNSEHTTSTVAGIGVKYGLHIDQIGLLAELNTQMLLGLVSPSQFLGELLVAGILEDTARQIMSEINEHIFKPLQEELRRSDGSPATTPPALPNREGARAAEPISRRELAPEYVPPPPPPAPIPHAWGERPAPPPPPHYGAQQAPPPRPQYDERPASPPPRRYDERPPASPPPRPPAYGPPPAPLYEPEAPQYGYGGPEAPAYTPAEEEWRQPQQPAAPGAGARPPSYGPEPVLAYMPQPYEMPPGSARPSGPAAPLPGAPLPPRTALPGTPDAIVHNPLPPRIGSAPANLPTGEHAPPHTRYPSDPYREPIDES